jgi:hypothetical protein
MLELIHASEPFDDVEKWLSVAQRNAHQSVRIARTWKINPSPRSKSIQLWLDRNMLTNARIVGKMVATEDYGGAPNLIHHGLHSSCEWLVEQIIPGVLCYHYMR